MVLQTEVGEVEKFAFIVGSALLDIVSTITDYRHLQDNIGTTSLNFGGVAYNIAINLRKLDVPTTLCTALNSSPITQMIMNEMVRQQVRTHIIVDNTLPDAIYNGMFYQGNEVASVWNNNVEKVTFSDTFIRKGLKNAACLLVTSCLSVDTMNRFITLANERGIPVILGGASLMEVAKLANVTGQVDYLFLNDNEMELLVASTPQVHSASALAVAKHTVCVVTKGADGVDLFLPDGGHKTFSTLAKDVKGNTLGAGDLFMSVVIKEMFFNKKTLDEALVLALDIATHILDRDDANLGTYNPLAANIQMVTDQAHHDKLTGAFNRHGVERFLTTPHLDKTRLCVLVIDADHFKQVNDTYGHDVGDQALVSLVQVIKANLRAGDVVARFGGEEFICLLQSTPERAVRIAERIRRDVAGRKHTGEQLNLTVSIGLCPWMVNIKNIDQLVKKADQALYEAKKQGRNRVVSVV